MSLSILKFFQPKDKIFQNLFEKTATISVEVSEIFLEAMKASDSKRFELLAQTRQESGIPIAINSSIKSCGAL